MQEVYFRPGDLAKVNKKIADRPVMVVEEIVKEKQATGSAERFVGIRCFWFDKEQKLQKEVFNFKDLDKCSTSEQK